MPSTIEVEKDVCRIRVEGDMTIYTALDLKQELVPCLAKAEQLDLDLSQVNEMDTAGLQLLILLKRETAKRGTRLNITGHSNAATEVIDTFSMAGFFGDPIVMQTKGSGTGKRQSKRRTAK
jgi:anti-anti-sigma factor